MNITLYSGDIIDLRTVSGDAIKVTDIAHALSLLCRFAGQVPVLYSVAQHSLLVLGLLEHPITPVRQLQALLHDATEAYMADLPRNVKHSPELEGYRTLEADLETRIMARFNLPPIDVELKRIDYLAGNLEWRQLMGKTVGPIIDPWPAAKAETEFLATYYRLEAARG